MADQTPTPNKYPWLPIASWIFSGGLLLIAVVFSIIRFLPAQASAGTTIVPTAVTLDFGEGITEATPPPFDLKWRVGSIARAAKPDTVIPDRDRVTYVEYEVQRGDSLFAIAKNYNITPESILWANNAVLGGSADSLSPGMILRIPPVSGVLYTWQEGDTLEAVADEFYVPPENIINYYGNEIDLERMDIIPGSIVMIPEGQGEFQVWLVPVLEGGGVDGSIFGPGGCATAANGAGGSGSFGWPTPIRELIGNDYWSGHLAVDLATGPGVAVYAADSGTVVYAGWSNGGYGYMVMIDHRNGYNTLYAHMSGVSVACGQSVGKGATIGTGGSSGNSTGPHLHYEVRYLNGFDNPWNYLP